jgi:hypothetical protein
MKSAPPRTGKVGGGTTLTKVLRAAALPTTTRSGTKDARTGTLQQRPAQHAHQQPESRERGPAAAAVHSSRTSRESFAVNPALETMLPLSCSATKHWQPQFLFLHLVDCIGAFSLSR